MPSVDSSSIVLTSQNDSMQLNSLTTKINTPLSHKDSISLANFEIVLKSLTLNISKLDNAPSAALISAILNFDWLDATLADRPEYSGFLKSYSNFLSVLVSSIPKYLHDVLKKLIRGFCDVHSEEYPHHKVLKAFVAYFPTSVNSIPKLLNSNFPHHMSASTKELTNYVRNSLDMIRYCPDLLFNIWQMVVECCIKLDVELQNELDDLDDDSIESLIDSSDDEIDEDDVEDDEDGRTTIDEVYTITSTRNIKKLVLKLDSLMELLIKATSLSFTSEELNSGNGVDLFNTLSSLFKSHILPTHFTKSIQFLLFRVSQYQPELADSFLVMLIDIAFNPLEIVEKRLKALQYLSLYIARAKNLTKHQVVFIVSYLIGWISKYIGERELEVYDLSNSNSSSTGGMERFKLFYSAFQALLYIFCFRHQQLSRPVEEIRAGESEWECEIDKFFQRAIIAKFNPLKYCDETVVFIFAKLATKLNVCYCYSIIEHNKRERVIQGNSSLPSSFGNFRHKQEFLDLEAYFPFDPMVLPVCKKIIKVNYIEWSEVNPANEDDDEDDDESGSHTDEDDDDDIDGDSDEDDDDDSIAGDSDEGISSDEEADN